MKIAALSGDVWVCLVPLPDTINVVIIIVTVAFLPCLADFTKKFWFSVSLILNAQIIAQIALIVKIFIYETNEKPRTLIRALLNC